MCKPGQSAVLLGPGEAITVDPLTTSGCVVFTANPSPDSAKYIVVPQAATTMPDFHSSFKLAGAALVMTAPPISAALQGSPSSPAQAFHDRLRMMEQDRSYPMTARARGVPGFEANTTPYPCPITVGGGCTFKVLSSLTNSTFTQDVPATVRSVGQHFVIYVDNAAPAPGLSGAQLDSLNTVFDTLVYKIDTTAFGRESDIDGNGKVLVLMSNVINRLVTTAQCQSSGYVVGFFFGADIDRATRSAWNNGEVFYSVVPDPAGTLSCAHSITQVEAQLPVTFAHEFQHMISYNQHILVKGATAPEELWLGEAMSHYAEERVGRAFLAVGDTVHYCAHVRGVLYDFGRYVANPGNTGLVTLTGLGTLDERGAWWSFVRFLVDQYAADTSNAAADAFTRNLVGTNLRGVANVTAVTAQPFETLSRRWVLANYVSDLPGFTAPANMKYKHWSFRAAFPLVHDACSSLPADFPSTYPLEPSPTAGSATNAVGTMYAGSAGTYQLLVQAPSGPPFTLLFSDASGAVLQSSMVPRLQIMRIR